MAGKNTIIEFLKSRLFLKNLGLSVLIFVVIVFLVSWSLGSYTRHGKEFVLPDYKGMSLKDIQADPANENFEFIVIDSVYNAEGEKGSIIAQDPLSGSYVKKGRKIYLKIIAIMPERITMPNLVDLSMRQAINILETHRLRTGSIIYRNSFDKNAVLAQLYRGKPVNPGTMVSIGTAIDLIVGNGLNIETASIPFVIGKTQIEALYLINIHGFKVGKETFPAGSDRSRCKVYDQVPSWNSLEPHFPGDSIQLIYKSTDEVNFEDYIRDMYKNGLVPDSLLPDTANDYF